MVAQLYSEELVAFGERGLWTTARRRVLPPIYCSRADNLRLSTSGALTLRKGYSDQTPTSPVATKNIESLHEYRQADETVEMIVAWDGGIGNTIDAPSNNDISGSVTDTDGTWFFQNFNDKCIGFQEGQKIIVYTGTGNFATVSESAGTAPTGGVGCAAYGRIWQVGSDGSTLYYSGLLDETDWGGAGAGSFDFNNIWTDGQDTIMAVRGFNGALVVWGKRHVVFFTDTAGSEIGLNPVNAYVTDIIAGTGCISQHTIQLVGEKDILFCSTRGVQSLGRLIQEKSNPIETLTAKVEQDIVEDIKSVVAASSGTIRSVYSPVEGLYILSFPTLATSYILEMRHLYQDEDVGGLRAPVFKWTLAPYAWAYRDNGDLLLGQTAIVGKYETYQDNGADYRWNYYSPWMAIGEEQGYGSRLKILKRIGLIAETTWGGNIQVQWATDFQNFTKTTNFVTVDNTDGAEWGVAEWGTAQWGATSPLQQDRRPANESGKYYRFGMSASTDAQFTLQQLQMYYKIGRVA